MELSGLISSNYDGWTTVDNTAFADYIYQFAKECGIAYEHNDGLGGKRRSFKN